MSTILMLGASAALGVLVGRLVAEPKIRTLRRLLRLAYHAAGHDRLTGLANRSLASQVFTLHELHRQPTIVVLLDLDRFKQVNDAYGHHVGDDLLRSIAEHLAAAAATHSGTAARLGGDEFLLLLPAVPGNPVGPVEQILCSIAQPTTLHTGDGKITIEPSASAGITFYNGSHGSLPTLLHQADIALYHAKKQRGGHRTYTPTLTMPRNAIRYGPRLRDDRPAGNEP